MFHYEMRANVLAKSIKFADIHIPGPDGFMLSTADAALRAVDVYDAPAVAELLIGLVTFTQHYGTIED